MVVVEQVFDSICRCFAWENGEPCCANAVHPYGTEEILSGSKGVVASTKNRSSHWDNGSVGIGVDTARSRSSSRRHRATLPDKESRQDPGSLGWDSIEDGKAHSASRSSLASSKSKANKSHRSRSSSRGKSPRPPGHGKRRSDIFRSRNGRPLPGSSRERSEGGGKTPRPMSPDGFCSPVPAVDDESINPGSTGYTYGGVRNLFICFANPVRDPESEDREHADDDDVRSKQTLDTCEDTMTSTVYFDNKLGKLIEQQDAQIRANGGDPSTARPAPVPLYDEFRVECSADKRDEIRRIVQSGRNRSCKLHVIDCLYTSSSRAPDTIPSMGKFAMTPTSVKHQVGNKFTARSRHHFDQHNPADNGMVVTHRHLAESKSAFTVPPVRMSASSPTRSRPKIHNFDVKKDAYNAQPKKNNDSINVQNRVNKDVELDLDHDTHNDKGKESAVPIGQLNQNMSVKPGSINEQGKGQESSPHKKPEVVEENVEKSDLDHKKKKEHPSPPLPPRGQTDDDIVGPPSLELMSDDEHSRSRTSTASDSSSILGNDDMLPRRHQQQSSENQGH